MRIDAHQHIWDPSTLAYPWMERVGATPLRRRFALHDVEPAARRVGIHATILVQAASSSTESRALLASGADSSGFVAGVVAWVDLHGDVLQQLEELRSARGGQLLIGIRHQVEDEPNSEWLADASAGIAAVGAAGLVYELLMTASQLPAALTCVRRHPQVQFVLDHCGKPDISHRQWRPWADLVTELARESNVACKLSGLHTQAGSDWTVAQLTPYAEHAIKSFGIDRVVAGSDWPVSQLVSDYETVWATIDVLLRQLSEAERALVLGGNAARLYRISQDRA